MAYAIKLAVAWRRGACEALLFAASSLRAASPAIAAPLPSSWGLAGRCLLSPLPLYCPQPLLCTRGARCTCHFVPVHAALSAPQRALLLPPTAWRSPRKISRSSLTQGLFLRDSRERRLARSLFGSGASPRSRPLCCSCRARTSPRVSVSSFLPL